MKISQWTIHMLSQKHPASLFFYSYLVAIMIGTGLLMLPWATVSGHIAFLDAVFTATSAVCVTGLTVVDTGSFFTLFGQGIILMLIQIGGLGIMTISVAFFQIVGKKILFSYRMAMQEIFSHTPREDIYQLVKSIFIFTAVAEFVGAVLLTIHWSREFSFLKAVYTAVFHSVSAFCNAGFCLFPDSLINYRSSMLLNITICCLIVLGGIGFPVVYEIFSRGFLLTAENKSRKFSVQTKTVLMTTAILIFLGAVVFLLTDMRHIGSGSWSEMILASVFQSVTARTAGFNTVDISSMNSTALTFMMLLMVVGASPGSCGGGVKTTTLALLSKLSWSRFRGRTRVNIFRKTIPEETVTRSISMVFLSVTIIFVGFFLILSTQQRLFKDGNHGEFLAYLFETISAFGTVGLSTGATSTLTGPGRVYIIMLMLIGRLGVTIFAYFLTNVKANGEIEYAEENVMIG
jgi:trk system potassium uptake protein TrkH